MSLGAELPALPSPLQWPGLQLTKEVLNYNYFPVGLRAQIIALQRVCVRTS